MLSLYNALKLKEDLCEKQYKQAVKSRHMNDAIKTCETKHRWSSCQTRKHVLEVKKHEWKTRAMQLDKVPSLLLVQLDK